MITPRAFLILTFSVAMLCKVRAQDFTTTPAGANDPEVAVRRALLESGEAPPVSIGSEVANFAPLQPLVKDSSLDLHQIKDKVIVLYFFSSRCGRCPEASRQLGFLSLTTPKTDMVAIGLMSSYYPIDEAFATATKSRIPFPVLWDKEGKTFETYGVNAVPIFAIIDSTGKLVKYCYIDKLRACLLPELNKLHQARKAAVN